MWKYLDVFATLLWKSIPASNCIIMHKTSYIIKFQLMIFNSFTFRYFFTVFFFAPPFKLSWSHRRNTGQRYNERKCINLYFYTVLIHIWQFNIIKESIISRKPSSKYRLRYLVVPVIHEVTLSLQLSQSQLTVTQLQMSTVSTFQQSVVTHQTINLPVK